jgi:hypothetical protein
VTRSRNISGRVRLALVGNDIIGIMGGVTLAFEYGREWKLCSVGDSSLFKDNGVLFPALGHRIESAIFS